MAFSTSKVNLKGCLFGPPSPKDYRTVFQGASIPDKVDLRQYCTPVEDQGQLGSCTANATVGALEYLYSKRDGQSPDLSRLFVYYNSRRIRGTINQDAGAYICDAMSSVLSFGACREEIWPYNVNTFTMEPNQQAYEEAQLHEAIQYSRVDAVEGSVSALAAGFPVVFGCRIPERCYQEASTTGVMPIPSDAEVMNNQQGGHCMLLVGYDKSRKMFIVRNSWGENWGDRGYVQIPFETISKCAPADCFWIIGELAKPGNFSVIRPGKPALAPRATGAAGATPSSGLAEKASKMREEIRKSLDVEIDASSRRIEKILAGTTGDKKEARGGKFGAEETCPLCGGSGQVDGQTCRQCGGSGYIPVYDKPMSRPAVRGGQKLRETATCPICQGNGACPSCSGKGTGCQRCGETGKCPVCGGSGVVGN
jgi:hypothetical protein